MPPPLFGGSLDHTSLLYHQIRESSKDFHNRRKGQQQAKRRIYLEVAYWQFSLTIFAFVWCLEAPTGLSQLAEVQVVGLLWLKDTQSSDQSETNRECRQSRWISRIALRHWAFRWLTAYMAKQRDESQPGVFDGIKDWGSTYGRSPLATPARKVELGRGNGASVRGPLTTPCGFCALFSTERFVGAIEELATSGKSPPSLCLYIIVLHWTKVSEHRNKRM